METTDNDIFHRQWFLVKMRKKYIKTIVKDDEENTKIEMKLLEERKFKSEVIDVLENFKLSEDLLNKIDVNVIDKQKVNTLQSQIKHLDSIATQIFRAKNCAIYKNAMQDT